MIQVKNHGGAEKGCCDHIHSERYQLDSQTNDTNCIPKKKPRHLAIKNLAFHRHEMTKLIDGPNGRFLLMYFGFG